MKSKLLVTFVSSIGFLSVCAPVMAHHGNAAYADKVTEFQNVTVTKFSWANPHALIFFDVKDAKGNVVNWICETAAPQRLRLVGRSKSSFTRAEVARVPM